MFGVFITSSPSGWFSSMIRSRTFLFNIYLSPIFKMFSRHPSISFHTFAYDFQLYTQANNHDTSALARLSDCIYDLINWFKTNSLQINANKTKIAYICQNKLSTPIPFTFMLGPTSIQSFTSISNIVVIFD